MADEPQNQPQQGTQGTAEPTGDANPAPNPQNPPQGAQGAAGPAAGDTDADPVDQTSDVQALRHEAASRRRALRQVEAERDQLKGREDKRDTAEVERLVAGGLADPSDLWSAVELAALRGDDGAVDAAKVGDALAGLLAKKPHYRKPSEQPNLHQGARQAEPERKSFGAALKRDGGR